MAEEVRDARRELGLDQKDVAFAANVSPRTVFSIEKGKATVRLDMLIRVLAAVGLRLAPEARGRTWSPRNLPARMSLDVHLDGHRIGTLERGTGTDYTFAYTPEVISEAGEGAVVLSNSLPVRDEAMGRSRPGPSSKACCRRSPGATRSRVSCGSTPMTAMRCWPRSAVTAPARW